MIEVIAHPQASATRQVLKPLNLQGGEEEPPLAYKVELEKLLPGGILTGPLPPCPPFQEEKRRKGKSRVRDVLKEKGKLSSLPEQKNPS